MGEWKHQCSIVIASPSALMKAIKFQRFCLSPRQAHASLEDFLRKGESPQGGGMEAGSDARLL